MKKLIVVLSLVFTALTAQAAPFSTSDLIVGGAPYYDIRSRATLTAADAAAVAAGKGLVCASTYTISTATTITSSFTAEKGCTLVKSGSGTIAFSGPFSAGLYQVFSGFSAGDVTFGVGSLLEVYPEWFGANGNGTTECATAFSSAISSLPNGGVVKVGYGNYKISSRLTLVDGMSLIGSGRNPTNGYPSRLNFTSVADIAIFIDGGSNIAIENLYITGQSSGTSNTIQMDGYCRDVTLRNLIINMTGTSTGSSVYITTSLITSAIDTVRTVKGTYGFYIGSGSTSLTLRNCYAYQATNTGYLVQGTYIGLYSCASDQSTQYGYLIQNAENVGLYSCGAETNGRTGFYIVSAVDGVAFIACRSHANRATSAATKMPSGWNLRASNVNITVENCQDSSPSAGTLNSIGSYNPGTDAYETPSPYITVKQNTFGAAIHANILTLQKGTTAARPTLTANDAGYFYMDTTLDADGLPIWWNGTKWIKSDGSDA